MKEQIIQVSGFGVNNNMYTQCDYMVVGVTNFGRVVISRGDGEWSDIGPNYLGNDIDNPNIPKFEKYYAGWPVLDYRCSKCDAFYSKLLKKGMIKNNIPKPE